ncbi:S8 family peptidase [Candidatus Solirubrobacter pratensis]|uniref:S8 family peptidase n=1 Tax=Candidatus Solirubrobacter pratensis TaxID=1298857 RepID=UPI0003FEF9E2|nr:S8 family peptidase [Candidatus Solirubrobacter pratensis]
MFDTCINRLRIPLGAALAAVVALLALGGPVAQGATAQEQLATLARKAPSRTVQAIAQFKPAFSEKKARALVRRHGGRVTGRIPLIHGLAIKATAKEAAALRRERSVIAVTLNGKVKAQGASSGRLNTNYPKTIRADRLWDRGITGSGVGVAVIDSGVAGDLVDFRGADGRSRVVANVVTSPGAKKAGDGLGHGTHVAGIIAGNSFNRAPSDPLYGDYVGVAPDANLIVVKASDEQGNSTVLDVINGIQFVVDHRDDYNIRVLNLSLAADAAQSYRTDPLDAAVEYAWEKGIVVVAASGNRGSDRDAVQYAPGNDPFAISVGGSDEKGNSGKGARAYWSSAGRTQDGFPKPEVMAPGAHIVSTLAPDSAFQYLCPTCIVGGAYFKAGGTSMAAPVVSGAIALLLQAKPYLTPDQVKAALMATDKPVFGSAGAGDIDVEAAASLGTVTPANRGIVPNTLIQALDRLNIDISHWTRSSWSAATGALSAGWARSSWSCVACGSLGAAIDPTRSSWSRSSWSSFGEGAEDEAAQLAAEQAAETSPPAAEETPAPAEAPAPEQPEATPTATPDAEVAP